MGECFASFRLVVAHDISIKFNVMQRTNLVCVCDEGLFGRHESDSIGIVRSRLKLASYRSVKTQRYIGPRTFLVGRNLLSGKLVGRAV